MYLFCNYEFKAPPPPPLYIEYTLVNLVMLVSMQSLKSNGLLNCNQSFVG